MDFKADWISPDGLISKQIVEKGCGGLKPTEACQCQVLIENHNNSEDGGTEKIIVVIGDSNCEYERFLDALLQTMFIGEKCCVKFKNCDYLSVHLIDFTSHGLIYEWNAKEKLKRSEKHKEAGNDLFKGNKHVDASYRFGKALKILHSIPIEVDNPPMEKDGVKITDIDVLKVKLYNNLASCYMREKDYDTAISLCETAFKLDDNNVKAYYKHAVSWYESRDYEKADKSFKKLLKIDPNNKLGMEKMKLNTIKLNEVQSRVNNMVKKMFKF